MRWLDKGNLPTKGNLSINMLLPYQAQRDPQLVQMQIGPLLDQVDAEYRSIPRRFSNQLRWSIFKLNLEKALEVSEIFVELL